MAKMEFPSHDRRGYTAVVEGGGEMSGKCVELEPVCEVAGRKWNLYSFTYKTEEGNFVGYLHALSFEHASYMLEELKQTAEIDGQILEAGKL